MPELQVRAVRHHLVGEPAHVRNTLQNARDRGALVSVSEPTLLPDYRVAVDMVVLERVPVHAQRRRPGPIQRAERAERAVPAATHAQAAESWYRRPRVWLTGGAITLVLAALGGLAYLVYLAALWVMDNLALVIISTLLGLIAIGAMLSRSGGGSGGHGCTGIHCSGCRG